MSEQIQNDLQENAQEETQEQVIELDGLKELLGSQVKEYVIPPIELDVENVVDTVLDESEFERGVKDYSYYAGAYTALVNVGMDKETALQILLNKDTMDYNIEMAKLNNLADLEKIKVQNFKIEGQQL